MSKYLYILDNGHGLNTYIKGLNPYRKSKIWKDGTQLFEYQFNRDIVKYLSFMLRENYIDYEILVPELRDIPLRERVQRANELAKNKDSILISIHSNHFVSESVYGFETHYYKTGLKIAEIFQKYTGQLSKDRGIKQSNFYIIKNTSMPAILTENGFYSNEKECKDLLNSQFQYDIAEQHFRAILEIENNKII